MTKARVLTAVALTGVVALGCGILTGPSVSGSLAIERFLVTPDHLDTGTKATLLWSVEGAETVSIDQGIGEVDARGSRQVSPAFSTTYTLTALGGTSSATATVRVVVGKPSPSPSAGPLPSPSPGPSPSPSPTPSPSPSPSPSASPSPSPSSNPGDLCGAQAAPPDTCGLTVERPSALPSDQCVQLTRLTAIPACPNVTPGTIRTITFDVNARSALPLTWRRAAGGSDAVTPASGSLIAQGQSSVTVNAVAYDSTLTFEVVDTSGRVLMRFTMRHR